MGELDDVLDAITKIHAASIEPAVWSDALGAVTRLIGGHGASLEVMQRPSDRHTAMYSYGLPAVPDYLDHFAPLTKRVPFGGRQDPGAIIYESRFISEAEILKDPFYMEFLAPYDMRYFVGGVVVNDAGTYVLAGVQRAPRHGPATKREIDLFATLVPHLRHAYEVMHRLQAAGRAWTSLASAVGWVADGVFTLNQFGQILHTNAAAQEILRRADGIRTRSGHVEFDAAGGNKALAAALGAVLASRDGATSIAARTDFSVARGGEAPPYIVSVRPMAGDPNGGAAALVFIHDPLASAQPATALLRQAFGLTAAEAHLAEALRDGIAPDAYAKREGVSPNTVYTHLRHIKDKTGRGRTVELMRLLRGFDLPARPV